MRLRAWLSAAAGTKISNQSTITRRRILRAGRSQCPDVDQAGAVLRSAKRVAQRPPELGRLDLEYVADLGFELLGEAAGSGAEEMHVHIAGMAKVAVFEMMVFEISDGMAHVCFAREPVFCPDFLACSQQARAAGYRLGQSADEQFRPERTLPQFRMCQIKIVLPLHDMIRVFVSKREAHAQHLAVFADDVKADDFHLFAAIERV